MRVRVWSGDESEYLGEGDYMGNVTVYIVFPCDPEAPTDAISSFPDAEVYPDEVPEGMEVGEIPDNPKIELDSGEIVYGCQVWWEPIAKSDPLPPLHP